VPVTTVVPAPLVLELLAWISPSGRGYAETLEAWHTHCPRLTVWEDALAARLVEVRRSPGGESRVVLTAAGAATLHDPPR
jgi:hypothetical protein